MHTFINSNSVRQRDIDAYIHKFKATPRSQHPPVSGLRKSLRDIDAYIHKFKFGTAFSLEPLLVAGDHPGSSLQPGIVELHRQQRLIQDIDAI